MAVQFSDKLIILSTLFMQRNAQIGHRARPLGFLDHTQLDSQPVGLLRRSDQLIADPAACAKHNKQDKNIHALSMYTAKPNLGYSCPNNCN
jgi:hypothetical protein